MEDYLNHTFTRKDIEALIATAAEESINLEFKKADALSNTDKHKDEIAKDVSSFANSDGGIIIYGIEEEHHKASKLSYIDGRLIKKEWLEQVISSRIHRKINDVRIDVIRYDKQIEKSIFVVKIPRSLSAPHISRDKKYYKRYNFESTPMEEYEVRDMYTRQGRTLLKIQRPTITTNLGLILPIYTVDVTVGFYVENIGQSIENLYKIEVHIHSNIGSDYNQSIHQYRNRREGIYTIFSIPNASPLFQNESLLVESIILRITPNTIDICYKEPLKVKLFYSNGIEELTFFLLDKNTFDILGKSRKLGVMGQSIALIDWVD